MIVIIGILAGLIVAAVGPARTRARNAAITLEINQLQMALEAYKDKYGDYPPDFFGIIEETAIPTSYTLGPARDIITRHLRKAFPQYKPRAGWDLYDTFRMDLQAAGIQVDAMTPAMALTFWLGGMPDKAGTASTKLTGFSADPALPFAVREDDVDHDDVLDPSEDFNGNDQRDGLKRLPPLFEFAETRLREVKNSSGNIIAYHYCPDAGTDSQPYVYFRARMDSAANRMEYGYVDTSGNFAPFHFDLFHDGDNVCVPYLEDAWVSGNKANKLATSGNATQPIQPSDVRQWAQPKTFQILSAGLDGLYGSGIAFRFLFSTDRIGGAKLTEGDYDNLSNFFSGKLEDHKQ